MATIDWPTGRSWQPARLAFGATTPKSAWAGFFTGQSQSISHLGDRLRVELTLPPCALADAGPREAYLMSLASTGDWVRLWHMHRPQPQGDLRGTPTLYASAAAGARSIVLHGASTEINLLSEVQAFTSPMWGLINTPVVTSNVSTRPNSATVAADRLEDDSVTVAEGLEQVVTIADDTSTYIGSIYIKATTGGASKTFSFELVMTGGTQVTEILRINTDTGAILGGTGTVTSQDSGTWWRVSQTITNNASGNTLCSFRLFPSRCDHNSSVTDATQTGSAIIWGAQLQPGSVLLGLSQPDLRGGDMLAVGSQLMMVAHAGAFQSTAINMTVPLTLPLRQAVSASAAVTWQMPTGNFQLLGDLSQVEYLPGRYQNAVTLQFVEAY